MLTELLNNNIKLGHFIISESGIVMRVSDQGNKKLIDLTFDSQNFSEYDYNSQKPSIAIGIYIKQLHQSLKSIKKKDSMSLFILKDSPNKIGLKSISKDGTKSTTTFINIQNTQCINIELPQGYGKPVIVQSNEFQKMCKELATIGNSSIKVRARKANIEFACDSDSIIERTVSFGTESTEDFVYVADFSMDQFSKISKIASLGTNIQIYCENDLPLLLKTSVGNIGKISIYIKDSLEVSEKSVNEDDEDSD